MLYEIYNPTITRQIVVDPYNDPSGLTYVSNSSLEYWGGKYWAIMDGSTQGLVEGSPDQQIWLTTSLDGNVWAPAVQPFRDSVYCNNPITGSAKEWQPNLVVVGSELWVTWSGANSYISKLTSPMGKWTNYRFEFSGTDVFLSSTITGSATGGRSLRAALGPVSDYYGFFTQNPIVLSSGIVACPLVFESDTVLSTQIETTNTFIRQLKFAALLKSIDGVNWSMTVVDSSDFGDFSAWEPFVVENPVGHVYVYIRSLDPTAADPDFMLVSMSDDGGETFIQAESTKMLVPSTRGFARRISPSRWMMTHADHPQESTKMAAQSLSKNRINGSMFFSRRGVNDFIPGVNFSGNDPSMNYPQFVTNSGDAFINYTSSDGVGVRRSLQLIRVSPLPDDGTAYVHPRSVNTYTSDPTDPILHSGESTPYYQFNSNSRAISTTQVTATTSITMTAWISQGLGGDVIVDTRNHSGLGQQLTYGGLGIRSLNFTHGFALPPGQPTFLAYVVDNSSKTVTLYGNNGGTSFSTKISYFRSIAFSGQPSDGNTVTINGTVYTFRNSPSANNDVTIGATALDTLTNLSIVVDNNSMNVMVYSQAVKLVMCRNDFAQFTVSSGSAVISESDMPLDAGAASIGYKALYSSSLTAYSGKIYETRIFNTALTAANMTYLYNAKASGFGYNTIAGTSTAPGGQLIAFDAANPNSSEFPSVGASTAAYCETIDQNTLRIHGEGSAGVELPYGATELSIRYKLGASPTGTDKYVIATFGTVESPLRLYIDADNPTSLYANGRFVASVSDPTVLNDVIVIVSTNKITIGSFEYYFSGKPRCFLGSAFPELLLPVSKHVEYNIPGMVAFQR